MRIFKNRVEAGLELAQMLAEFSNTDAIVLALPRGGVIVGAEVAKALALPLDIIVTLKIGAPDNPNCAIGVIDLDGHGVWNEYEVSFVDKKWLDEKVSDGTKEAMCSMELYRGKPGTLVLTGKTVIIIDDCIANGHTMRAALNYAKKLGAQKIVVAAPIAHPLIKCDLEELVRVCTIEAPSPFYSVEQYYEDFPQVSEIEVMEALDKIIN